MNDQYHSGHIHRKIQAQAEAKHQAMKPLFWMVTGTDFGRSIKWAKEWKKQLRNPLDQLIMNSSKNPPAFPIPIGSSPSLVAGMTLLDYFAGQAVAKATSYRPQGLRNWIRWLFGKPYAAYVVIPYYAARDAYNVAAAMLEEREKRLDAYERKT